MKGLGKKINYNKVDCFNGRRFEEAFAMTRVVAVIPTASSWDEQGKESSTFNKVDCFRGRRPEEAFAMTPPPSALPPFRTSEPKSHFRFYASSMGRFLKPDNIIPDITNPQNWNAYTYVKGNPVNFNDPLGHTGQGMAKPYYFVNVGSASWLNWGTYYAFMSELYGGNQSFSGGGIGGQAVGGVNYYSGANSTSGQGLWNALVILGFSTEFSSSIAGGHYAFYCTSDSQGEMVLEPYWVQDRLVNEKGSDTHENGYFDVNFSFGTHLFVGVTIGVQMDKITEEFHPYLGFGVIWPQGPSSSCTASNESSVTEGWNSGVQWQIWPFFAWQRGVAGGEFFREKGLGFPAGIAITNYYVFPEIKLEPSNSESYTPANRKFFSPW